MEIYTFEIIEKIKRKREMTFPVFNISLNSNEGIEKVFFSYMEENGFLSGYTETKRQPYGTFMLELLSPLAQELKEITQSIIQDLSQSNKKISMAIQDRILAYQSESTYNLFYIEYIHSMYFILTSLDEDEKILMGTYKNRPAELFQKEAEHISAPRESLLADMLNYRNLAPYYKSQNNINIQLKDSLETWNYEQKLNIYTGKEQGSYSMLINDLENLIKPMMNDMLLNNHYFQQCEICNQWFITDTKHRTVYCKNESCQELKSKLSQDSYQKRIQKDKFKTLFNQTRNTLQQRKSRGKLSDPKFKQWKADANEKMEQAKQNKTSFAEFETWIYKSLDKI